MTVSAAADVITIQREGDTESVTIPLTQALSFLQKFQAALRQPTSHLFETTALFGPGNVGGALRLQRHLHHGFEADGKPRPPC